MREKDYQKLYECEFPIMNPPVTRKDIFRAKLAGKPIMLNVTKYSSEERDALEDLLWYYDAFTPVEDYNGWYAEANLTINLKIASKGKLTDWFQRMCGRRYKISHDEYHRRLKQVNT